MTIPLHGDFDSPTAADEVEMVPDELRASNPEFTA